jgi:hypothetical protein
MTVDREDEHGPPRSVGVRSRQKRSCEFQIQWFVWLVLTRERELADAGGPGLGIYKSSDGTDLLMTADGFRCPAARANSFEVSCGWCNQRPVQLSRDFRAHEFEKHPNAALIVEFRETAQRLSERSRQNAELLTDLEISIEADRSGAFCRSDQRLDNARRHRHWLLDAHDQRGNSDCAVDAAPAGDREIEDHENIAGKQWRNDVAHRASVANGAPHSGCETPVALAMQVELRARLAVVKHPRHKPALPPLEIQTPPKRFDWSDRILGNRNRVQHEIIPDKVFALKERHSNIETADPIADGALR